LARNSSDAATAGILIVIILVAVFAINLASGPTPVIMLLGGGDTQSGGTQVASTWGDIVVHYTDGTSQQFSSTATTIQMALLRLQLVGKSPSTMDFDAIAVEVPNLPMPFYTDLLGQKIYASDMVLYVKTDVRILVNGAIAYTSPSNGLKAFWSGSSTVAAAEQLLGLAQSFQTGTQQVLFSLQGWNANQYLSSSQSTEFEYYFTQEWSLYGVWQFGTAGPIQIGAPLCNPVCTRVSPSTPIWSTITNPTPIAITAPPNVNKQPYFKLGVAPLTATIGRLSGTKRTFQLIAQTFNIFSSPITFGVTGLPNGVSYSLQPVTSTPNATNGQIASSVLTLTASSSAQDGNYEFQVTANGGGTSDQVTVTLTIVDNAGPDQSQGAITAYVTIKTDKTLYSPMDTITISGTVTDYNENGLPNVQVSLSSDFNFTKQLTTDSTGAYSTTIYAPSNPGVYHVTGAFAGNSRYGNASASTGFQVNSPALSACPLWLPSSLRWLCGSTWGIPNWAIVAAVVILFLLALAVIARKK
jgi:hypothetical protein